MEYYLILKTIHILSSTILFGTGIGIAFFMLRSYFSDNLQQKLYATSNTVFADCCFTLPAAIIQPISGSTLINGNTKNIFGWQSLHSRHYSRLGKRWLGNCNVPDFELFPQRYPDLKTIRFYAGLELSFVHITLWALSWLVRDGLIRRLENAAPLLLKLSFLFDWLGSANSGFHMELKGKGKAGEPKTVTFELIARGGDGPYIPCMPSILLTKKLLSGNTLPIGATPCLGMISKQEYLSALNGLDITWQEFRKNLR